MNVRKANRKDAKGIAHVHVQSWRETYKGIINQDYLDSLDEDKRYHMWKESLETNGDQPLFVAENDAGEIIGFASFGKERTKKFEIDGELYAIYILAEFKGKKVGTKLFLAGVQELLRQDIKSLLVWVISNNPSKRFYESFNPIKVKEEEFRIAGEELIEVAYSWNDLNALKTSLVSSLEDK
ncbi:GNAT family N-acetyltransferase [Cytobacillus spartinae]